MSQKYVIVHFIDKSKVPSEFPSSEWPLHVTLLANFTLGESLELFKNQLQELALRERPFAMIAEGEALFGPKHNISVSLIRPSNSIQKLHDKLSSLASKHGAVFDEPAFMGEGFRPHASIQVNERLLDKQKITLNDFTLVDMFPRNDMNRRRIIETYKLGSH